MIFQHQLQDLVQPKLHNMSAKKYFLIDKNCPFCDKLFKTFNGGQLARQYCSKSCALKDREVSQKTKDKLSNIILQWNINNNTNPDYISKYNAPIGICLFCKKNFPIYNKKLKFCSKSCSSAYHRHSDKTKNLMREIQIKLIESDLHIGWTSSSRKNRAPSYPEKYIINLLEELKISYEREFKVKRWFIDFADPIRKLALEIDGKQHELPERKASDEKKDAYLIENGWQVLRIKWKKTSKEFREQLIDNLLSFFKTIL